MKRRERDFVTVGVVEITGIDGALPRLEQVLSKADRDRADRFRRPDDRTRFILGRALVARLLKDELGYSPETLDLEITEHGRPHLAALPEAAFSISHAGNWVAVALTTGARLGIDLESLDRQVDLPSLSKRIFNEADLDRFRALPELDRPLAFFRAWTGKEAVLKAKGVGLLGGIQKISVPLVATPAEVKDPDDAKTTWQVQPVRVESGYVASLACDLPVAEVATHIWESDHLA